MNELKVTQSEATEEQSIRSWIALSNNGQKNIEASLIRYVFI